MSSLTIRNLSMLGFGVFAFSMAIDALPVFGSAAYGQNQIVTRVSSALGQTRSDAETPTSQSLSQLLRVGNKSYQVDFDPSISGTVLSNSVVRKISYGKESLVSIVTTPTGTYSTDGFASSHVRYPGVSVAEVLIAPQDTDLQILVDGKFVDWSTILELLADSRL